MKTQNANNHKRYYYPHHFIFYPACLTLIALSINKFADSSELKFIYALFAATIILIAWLSFMMRQHYAMMSQNRTIRLEMRLRYYQITHERFEPIEQKLNFGQLAALRFASDEELPALIDRTVTKNLSPSEIKKQIQTWLPDYMRI